MRTTGTAIAAATLLLGILAGCGRNETEAQAAADALAEAGAGVAADEGQAGMLDGDGAMAFGSGERARLPDGFPDDIFLPEDYRLESTLSSPEFTMVTLRTHAQLSTLATEAKTAMEAAGWTQQMMAGDDSSRIYAFRQADRVASLSFDRHEDGGVLYTVQLSSAPD